MWGKNGEDSKENPEGFQPIGEIDVLHPSTVLPVSNTHPSTICPHLFLIERGVKGIEVFRIQIVGCNAQSLSEALIMDNFAGAQELNRITDIRVIRIPKDVIVRQACFLFGAQIFVEIC